MPGRWAKAYRVGRRRKIGPTPSARRSFEFALCHDSRAPRELVGAPRPFNGAHQSSARPKVRTIIISAAQLSDRVSSPPNAAQPPGHLFGLAWPPPRLALVESFHSARWPFARADKWPNSHAGPSLCVVCSRRANNSRLWAPFGARKFPFPPRKLMSLGQARRANSSGSIIARWRPLAGRTRAGV